MSFILNYSTDALFIAGLYNRYRIKKITCRVSPDVPKGVTLDPMIAQQDNPLNLVDKDYLGGPTCYMRRDYEDANGPTGTLDAFRNSKGCFKIPWKGTRKFTIKPAVLSFAYEGVVATGYMPVWRRWISTDDLGVEHYGLKWWIEPVNEYFNKVFQYNGGWHMDIWLTVEYKDWRRGTT